MSLLPDTIPHEAAAFMRRVEKTLRPGHPSFALVVLDDNGQPHTFTFANRTSLTVAGAALLDAAVDLEKQDPCACTKCDEWTARARLALQAMGREAQLLN